MEPTPRPQTKEWKENHLKHKEEITKGTSGDVRVVIGDSIIKHLDKATVLMKGKYEGIKWVNAGIGGDGVENVHWRLRDYPDSAQVSRIIIAAGTNNLFSDSAEEIVQEVEKIHELATKKFPKAFVWVQSILPRLHLEVEIEEKIQEINSALLKRYGEFFFNPYLDFVSDKGEIMKHLFRADGVHLSPSGNNKLGAALMSTLTKDIRTSMSMRENPDLWSASFNKKTMTFKGQLEGKEAEILLDTGSFVTLINGKIVNKLTKLTHVRTSVSEIVGIGNVTKPVKGAV